MLSPRALGAFTNLFNSTNTKQRNPFATKGTQTKITASHQNTNQRPVSFSPNDISESQKWQVSILHPTTNLHCHLTITPRWKWIPDIVEDPWMKPSATATTEALDKAPHGLLAWKNSGEGLPGPKLHKALWARIHAMNFTWKLITWSYLGTVIPD